MNKRGQIAIFVIIALVIVGVILVIYSYPRISSFVAPRELSPTQYLSDCIGPEVNGAVETLAKQGGDENPEGYITYMGTKVKYLCYVSGYYQTCVVQQPMLASHFADELSRMLNAKISTCTNNLKKEYEKRGDTVEMGKINSSILMVPGKINIEFLTPLRVAGKGETRTFEGFNVEIESQIYDLLSISTSIVDYEATYGDSETTLYMNYYPDLRIEKVKLEDGVKIYKVSNVVTKDRFIFATRSLVWPPGYGLI